MSETKKNWVALFIEKNAWAILVSLLALGAIYGSFNSVIEAHAQSIENNAKKIEKWEKVMDEVVQLQKDMIELQTKQDNDSADIKEVKADVKTLINR